MRATHCDGCQTKTDLRDSSAFGSCATSTRLAKKQLSIAERAVRETPSATVRLPILGQHLRPLHSRIKLLFSPRLQ